MSLLSRILGQNEPAPKPIKKRGRPPGRITALDERNVAITLAYEHEEMNATELGEKYGLTRERVCQILRRSNTISRVDERKRLAREELQAEADAIKGVARAERARVIAEGVALVRDGESISEATRKMSLPPHVLQDACKKAGIESRHGRWRDMQPKIERVRELRAQGLTWAAINYQSIANGFGEVYGAWVARHAPDLVQSHPRRLNRAPVVAREEKTRRLLAVHDSIWTEERTKRLVELWLGGASAYQCSVILGAPCTRNAVIGKINRLRAAGGLQNGAQS